MYDAFGPLDNWNEKNQLNALPEPKRSHQKTLDLSYLRLDLLKVRVSIAYVVLKSRIQWLIIVKENFALLYLSHEQWALIKKWTPPLLCSPTGLKTSRLKVLWAVANRIQNGCSQHPPRDHITLFSLVYREILVLYHSPPPPTTSAYTPLVPLSQPLLNVSRNFLPDRSAISLKINRLHFHSTHQL